MVAIDGIALFTRITVCIAGLLTIPLGYSYANDRRMHRGEYYPLLLFAATGMTLLASSADLIMVFISVEILSLSLYILTAFARRDLNSQEAAFKYFILGAFSSALLLYGIALVYGVTGSTNIAAAAGRAFQAIGAPESLVLAAMALLLVGFAFKTAVVPFHMWTPDVYQGAPTPVTGFMAAATKAAAFAAFLRVFVGGLGALQWTWTPAIWVLAVLTMLGGAVLAVVQRDLKRMLGYSAIAHAGYVLLGLVAVTREGISGLLLYLLIYTFMSLGAFGVLSLLRAPQPQGDVAGRPARAGPAVSGARGHARPVPVVDGRHPRHRRIHRQARRLPRGHGGRADGPGRRGRHLQRHRGVLLHPRDRDHVHGGRGARCRRATELVTTAGLSVGLSLAAAAVVVLGIIPGVVIDFAQQAASIAG